VTGEHVRLLQENNTQCQLCRTVFLNRWAAAQYRALASLIPGPRLIKKEFTRPRSHKV
jgi:hypothetical protein